MATDHDSVQPVVQASAPVNRPVRSGTVCRSKVALTVAAALMSGSLLSTCQTRMRDAFVGSTKAYFLSLFDPETIVDMLVDDADGSADGP